MMLGWTKFGKGSGGTQGANPPPPPPPPGWFFFFFFFFFGIYIFIFFFFFFFLFWGGGVQIHFAVLTKYSGTTCTCLIIFINLSRFAFII